MRINPYSTTRVIEGRNLWSHGLSRGGTLLERRDSALHEHDEPECSLLRICLVGALALAMLLVTLLEMTLP